MAPNPPPRTQKFAREHPEGVKCDKDREPGTLPVTDDWVPTEEQENQPGEAEPVGEIPSLIGQLKRQLERLNKELCRLSERLRPVHAPCEAPKADGSPGPGGANTPLGQELCSLIAQVSVANQLLGALSDSIEL